MQTLGSWRRHRTPPRGPSPPEVRWAEDADHQWARLDLELGILYRGARWGSWQGGGPAGVGAYGGCLAMGSSPDPHGQHTCRHMESGGTHIHVATTGQSSATPWSMVGGGACRFPAGWVRVTEITQRSLKFVQTHPPGHRPTPMLREEEWCPGLAGEGPRTAGLPAAAAGSGSSERQGQWGGRQGCPSRPFPHEAGGSALIPQGSQPPRQLVLLAAHGALAHGGGALGQLAQLVQNL